ncbi:MAG: hypothetical protein D6784_03365 [Chloroflexi bacterium]|nr:MAG: hypothetical protein D6784_03365 [Chloroflexota bacterium]
MVQIIDKQFYRLVGGLLVLLVLLLWLAPAEKTLGQVVKLIYLHGAMVRTAVLLFAVGLPVNVVGLLTRRTGWQRWGQALVWAAVLVWLVHTLLSMLSTYAAWGVWIAWYEPRVRFTFITAGVGLVVIAAAWLVGEPRFTALAFAVLSLIVLGMLPQLGLVQHPFNPIGTSTSAAIRGFYGGILLVSAALGGLLARWLYHRTPARME